MTDQTQPIRLVETHHEDAPRGSTKAAPDGSRFSARWRILGWLLLTVAVGLAAVVISVHNALVTRVATDANESVSQELGEFRQFASEGLNPETATPFTSVEPLLNVYLRRQAAGGGEVMLGIVEGSSSILEVRGAGSPAIDVHDIATDDELMATIRTQASGVAQTPAGELRWGKTEIVTSTGERGFLVVGQYTQNAIAEVRSTTNLMIWLSLGALALTAGIGWAVAGQILYPIRVMRKTAAQISQEDLTRRIPVEGKDDLAVLANEFNKMLDRLESAFATEQRFVDDAGHELRTPITVIRGHLELLSDDPEERRQTLALVTQELDRMSRIVTDLLALAKAERPDFVQIGEPVDLAELTLDIDAKVQQLAPRTWVLTHVADGEARIDAQRVTQAMLQLAQNATQHTDDGDEIRIASSFGRDDDGQETVVFSVIDTGPGVTAAEASIIFERFARGSARRPAGDRTGAGLGLAIVRAIADGHQGSVFLDSRPGEGATFGLILPRRMEHVAADETVEAPPISLDDLMTGATDDSHPDRRRLRPDLVVRREGAARRRLPDDDRGQR